MIRNFTTFVVATGLACASAAAVAAQTPAKPAAQADPQATAYYNFAMGHMYSELAAMSGFRSEYVDQAIQFYKAALKADPGASLASEELTDLYTQAGRLADAVNEGKEILKRDPDNLDARRMLGRVYSRLIEDRGRNRINEENLRAAIDQFEKVTQKDPSDLDSWLMLGRLYKFAQQSPEAEKAYKKALELDGENENALSGLALVYTDLGDTKSALEMWRRLADTDPRPQVLQQLAQAYDDLHDYASAAQTLQRALEMAPRDLEIKSKLGEMLLLAGKTDDALKVYSELAQADPRNAGFQLRLSQIYRQKRDFAKARQAQQRAQELKPDSLDIRYNDVSLLEAEGRFPDAIARLRDILAATAKKSYSDSDKSNRVFLLTQLAVLYRSNEQFPEAVETYRMIADLMPEEGAKSAAQIIDTYRQARDYTKAEQEAEAAYKNFPGDRAVRLMRASLLADLGRTEEAAAATKQLLDGKNDREVYLALAQVYDKGKKYAEMAQALDSAEKLSSSDEDKETVYFLRGAMYESTQKLELAEAEFRKVLAIDPNSAAALNYLGYMLADRNLRLNEAEQMIGRALELDPNNGAYLDSMGWVCFRLGKLDEAENYLRRAVALTQSDPTVHDHLGDVYLQQGKLREAIAQWEASLKYWQASSKSEADPAEIAKVQKKLESTKVRLAKEAGPQR
jgi:tetratricopeptide (TPR) repeat protein